MSALLRARDPRDISISALCAEAGVSRPTFYQHFASVDDVAVAGIERRLAELEAGRGSGTAGDPDAAYRLLVGFLSDLDAERETWRRTIGRGTAFPASRDAVEAWLADRLGERAPSAGATAVRYAAAGLLGAVRAWLLDEPGPDRPDVPALAARLVELSGAVLATPTPRAPYAAGMKTRLTCPCGEVITGADEDELVELTQQHLADQHPGMSYGRDEILFIAT